MTTSTGDPLAGFSGCTTAGDGDFNSFEHKSSSAQCTGFDAKRLNALGLRGAL